MEVAEAALLGRAGPGSHATAEFPFILANVANKALRAAYDSTPRTFTAWAWQASITASKRMLRTKLASAPDLEWVPEPDEFTYGTIGQGRPSGICSARLRSDHQHQPPDADQRRSRRLCQEKST